MKNIKFIIGFSIFGFLISFVSGFASNSTFLKMLLNAFIFLFVFAFLGAAIVFLWDKFLSTEFQNAEYVTSRNDNSSKTAGQTVDITIQDEALQNDDNASQFFVGSNHQMLTKEDVAEYICYHGSKDLNEILNYVLNFSINSNLQNLFKQVKEEHIVTYQHKEWISLGTKLNTALLDIKSKGEQDLFVDDYIYKLSGYRFLLTIFAYDI
jgi:hypothetical protein